MEKTEIRKLVERRVKWVLGLSAVGLLITVYLTYQHYKPAGTSFCNLSNFFNCDIVNKSIYAELFGIPVAVFGFIAYLFIFLISLGMLQRWNFQRAHVWLRAGNVLKALHWFVGVGVLFSLVLTYIEFFKLYAVCILCLTQQVVIIAVFIILMSIRYAAEKDSKKSGTCEFC